MMKTKMFFRKTICIVFVLWQIAMPLKAQPAPANKNILFYGVAWYPEQWDSARWEKDIKLMKSLHFNVVRVGEFAWSKLQTSENTFDFEWLERAIDLAYKNGIYTVIGTPTAAPPAWMSSKYPEILRVEENGTIAIHGARGQYNPANKKYLEFCATIARKLGEKFGKHPGVIGWQIDNEYWPFSFDAETKAQFQHWLKEKYQTLENLNKKWGTAYWSQEYFDWSQIPFSLAWQNPCLVLEIKRFKSFVLQNYQQNQVVPLRKAINQNQLITTNFHGEFQHCDAGVLGENLDFLSFDPYVGTGHLNIFDMGFRLDRLRGYKNKSFWIMETQPGHVNWAPVSNELNPMETRRMVWHQIAHGADAVLFWQWRSGVGGQEQDHGAILGQSGNLKPIAKEIEQIGREIALIDNKLINAVPKSKVALWFTMDDQWALAEQKFHKDYDPVAVAKEWYMAAKMWGVDIDIISRADELNKYSVVLAPCRFVLSERDAVQIKEACENGTHIILGARTGRKNIDNGLIEDFQPGYGLNKLLGADVEEFYALENPVSISGKLSGNAKIWGEWLTVTSKNTEVICNFENHPWLSGKPAIVSNKVGKGTLSYIAFLPEMKLFSDIMGYFLQMNLIGESVTLLPEGLEKCSRSIGDKKFVFYINHGSKIIEFEVASGKDLLSGKNVSGKTKINPDEVLVIESIEKKL